MPTLCNIAGIETPKETDGTSFLPMLIANEQNKHEYLYYEYPEYGGQQSVRIGNWKAIRKNIFKGNMKIELYDLGTDIQEQKNVADQHPAFIDRINEIMKKEHTPSIQEGFRMKQLGDQ